MEQKVKIKIIEDILENVNPSAQHKFLKMEKEYPGIWEDAYKQTGDVFWGSLLKLAKERALYQLKHNISKQLYNKIKKLKINHEKEKFQPKNKPEKLFVDYIFDNNKTEILNYNKRDSIECPDCGENDVGVEYNGFGEIKKVEGDRIYVDPNYQPVQYYCLNCDSYWDFKSTDIICS